LKTPPSVAALGTLLRRRGLRETPQRRAVAALLLALEGPVSVTEMFELLRVEKPEIDFTTVYRTLKMLLREGLATGTSFSDGSFRYEARRNVADVVHLVCRCCGRKFRVHEPALAQVRERIASKYGVDFGSAHHEVWVRCQGGACSATSGPKTRW
jgi:Fur family transcriptional regulator, ferric uptake regulator